MRNVGWATTLERLQGRKDRTDSVRQKMLLSALSQYSSTDINGAIHHTLPLFGDVKNTEGI